MSTLEITRPELLRHVGRMLGFNRDPTAWTTTELQDVNDAVDAGVRQFYTPPILPRERTAHLWSWLQPVLSQALTIGVADYTLPATFGGFCNELSFAASDNVPVRPLKQTGMEQILAKRQTHGSATWSAPPTHYAVTSSTTTGEARQRFSLALWPAPDQAYTLSGEYFFNPAGVSDAEPYPLGGQPHGETLLASCLAAADLQMNQAAGTFMGKFMERLAASVSFDRSSSGPFHFGYNGDRSAERFLPNRRYSNMPQYNGTPADQY